MSTFSKGTFEAVSWTFCSLGIVLTAGRYVIRKTILAKFHWDDLAHGLALALSIVYVACYTVMFPILLAIEKGKLKEGPQPSASDLNRFVRFDVAIQLLAWLTIYLVKLSLLLYFRTIFGISPVFLKVWWAVLGFTIIAFGVNFISPLWTCATPSQLFQLDACFTPKAYKVTDTFVEAGCAMNVASNIFIMALPLWMIKGLKMSRGQKIALGALFLLATIDILFDVVRVGVGIGGGIVTSAAIFDVLEPVVAVIVSTLPTYRALFVVSRKKESSSYNTLKPSPITSRDKTARSYELAESISSLKSNRGGDLQLRSKEGSLDSSKGCVDPAYVV